MLRRLWTWINERWPASAAIRVFLTEDIPGGASYFYCFGSSVLIVFILQAVTGICQLFYYAPTTQNAYLSLSFLRLAVPFGWLIHNLHFWGATAMVTLVLLHMTRNFLWGAYKNPRQLTWIIGVFLFLAVFAMMFTGSPLPWDEKGYWATEVGTSIAGTVPLVGAFTERLLRGGDAMGQLTISRFLVIHAALISSLLALLIILHLVSFRRYGSVGPWSEARRVRSGPFWPDQLQKDTVFVMAVFLILLGLAVFVPPPFSGPADPMDALFTPKPEWNFLFLYQALRYFPGRLEAVGTVGIPLVLIVLMLAVPFIDRRPERNPAKRPVALVLYFAVFAAAIALSVVGAGSSPGAGRGAPAAAAGPPPLAAPVEAAASANDDGPALFSKLKCSGCHAINGVGGTLAPDLAHEKERNRTAEWIKAQISNPRSHNPNTVMPAFDKLGPTELGTLAQYLLSLKPEKAAASNDKKEAGAAAAPKETLAPRLIGSVEHGGRIFRQYCQSCHGEAGRAGVPNPGSDDGTVPPLQPIDRELYDADPAAFALKIDAFPQHGATPEGTGPAIKMPAFGDTNTLTQQQIANLEAYILSLNGVDRAKIVHPGIAPPLFFILAAGTFVVCGLGFGLFRLTRKRRPAAKAELP